MILPQTAVVNVSSRPCCRYYFIPYQHVNVLFYLYVFWNTIFNLISMIAERKRERFSLKVFCLSSWRKIPVFFTVIIGRLISVHSCKVFISGKTATSVIYSLAKGCWCMSLQCLNWHTVIQFNDKCLEGYFQELWKNLHQTVMILMMTHTFDYHFEGRNL